MISKWGDFILENKIVSLILEDKCICSDDFIKIIKDIFNKSKVASVIYFYFSKN